MKTEGKRETTSFLTDQPLLFILQWAHSFQLNWPKKQSHSKWNQIKRIHSIRYIDKKK